MASCPQCGDEVMLCSIRNPRNDKWTIVPLNVSGYEPGKLYNFSISQSNEVHEAVDIMGDYAGTYPVAEYTPGQGAFSLHNPSHYLGDVHDVSE